MTKGLILLTHPTLDQMHSLGLAGMAAAWRDIAEQDSAGDLTRDEWLGLMLDREIAARADRRLTNRLASAKLRFVDACIENVDFATHRGMDRRNILSLAQGAWLNANENLIITGQTGTGKTWLGCAFGRQAARQALRAISAHAAPVRGSCSCASRRPLPARGGQACPGPTAYPG